MAMLYNGLYNPVRMVKQVTTVAVVACLNLSADHGCKL